MKLKIKESSWSGWTRDYEPKEKENLYDVKLNEKYIIATRMSSHLKDGESTSILEDTEIFSFEIFEINSDSIKIRTFQPFLSDLSGMVSIETNKKEFIISYEKELKLMTPTKDYGEIYYLTLIK